MADRTKSVVSVDDVRGEILEGCMRELREALMEDLRELYTLLTRRVVAYMNSTRESFRREFVEGLKTSLKSVESLGDGVEDFVDASLSDLYSEVISAVDEGMSGTLRWTPIEQVFRRTFEVVEIIAQKLAEEVVKNMMEREENRREYLRRLFTEKSTKWRILSILHEKGPMTSVQVASEAGVSQHTARKHLNSLVREGFVECDKSSKPYIYIPVKTPW